MSKSITAKTLALAKKKEAERLNGIKEAFLDIMRKELEGRVNHYSPWTVFDDSYYYYEESIFDGFNVHDIITVGTEVGFKLKHENWHYEISVPALVKGQRKTPAQLMVYRCNMEIKKRIAADKALARRICKDVFAKIKAGDFEACKVAYSQDYKVTVHVENCPKPSEVFRKEAEWIFGAKHFNYLSINADEGIWEFNMREI